MSQDSLPGRHLAFGVLAISLAVLFIYAQVSGHDFVSYDDRIYVLDNQAVLAGLSWEGVEWAFQASRAANWHPLTWLSHMLDVELFGVDAGAHHVVNALLHALNGIGLFLFLAWTTRNLGASLLVALVFVVHPLRAESVAWVSERKDLLGGLFWMLALLAYAAHARRSSWKSYLAVTLALVLGLLCKPMLVTLPCVFLLLDVWPLDRFSRSRSGRLLLEKLPWFALIAASSWVTVLVQAKGGATSSVDEVPFAFRLRNALESTVAYVRDNLWPQDLSYFYPHPLIESGERELWEPQLLVAVLVLAALSLLFFLPWRRRPFLAVGWAWYLGTLVPVIGLVQVGMQARADRYTYLPSIGLWIAIVFGVFSLVRGRGLTLAKTFGVLALVPLALLARERTADWRDSVVLFRRALEVDEENYVAHEHLGVVYSERGELEPAETHLRRSLELKGANVTARHSLGNLLVRAGRPQEALGQFRAALRLNPRMPSALNGAGDTLVRLGRMGEAEEFLLRCIEIQPRMFEAQNNLGMVYAQTGRPAEAERHFRLAAELEPRNPSVRANLGSLHAQQENFARARDEFLAVLELQPANTDARWNLGYSCLRLGELDQAAREFERVLASGELPSGARRNPLLVASDLADLAQALSAAGDGAARGWARRAIESAPPDRRPALTERLQEVLSGS